MCECMNVKTAVRKKPDKNFVAANVLILTKAGL